MSGLEEEGEEMNWLIWIIAVFFGFAETAYFGWNTLPNSPEELICDGITLILMVLALKYKS